MTQELFGVIDRIERGALLLGRPVQQKGDVRMAKIRRKVHLAHRRRSDARIRHFIANQFFEFFANAFRDALGAVRVQVSA